MALTIYQANSGLAMNSTPLPPTCDSDEMKTLRWRIGDATVFRIGELDATAALQGLIPKFDLADVARAGWLIPAFVGETGRLPVCGIFR